MARVSVNGRSHDIEVDPDTPLLWVLRDVIGLMGTKYGCGIGQCGACTVHIDGTPIRSCSLPVRAIAGKAITTIEGLPENGALHKVQTGLDRSRRPAMRLLPERHDHGGGGPAAAEKPKPTDAEIDAAITNICRCGTYQRDQRRDPRGGGRVSRGQDAMSKLAAHRPPQVPRQRRRARRRARARLRNPVWTGHTRAAQLPSARRKSPPGS